MAWFRALAGLISIVSTLFDWFKRQQMRAEVQREVVEEIKKDEHDATAAAEVELDKPTTSDATADSLRHGKF